MRHGFFAPGRRVVDAKRQAALVDTVKAIGGPDAGADIFLAAFDDLLHHMRIGHMGAGHANHIQLAGLDGIARGRHIGDAGGVEGGHADLGPDTAGEIEVRCGFHAVDRDHIGHRRIGMDAALDDIEEIDEAGIAEHLAKGHAFIGRYAALFDLIRSVADAKQEVFTDALAAGGQHLHREAGAVFQGTAIGGGEAVGERRHELIHQVAVAFEFDAIEPGCRHPF
ncbi:MAG: hypothetical protein ACD_54C00103G0001, partial [uncultured bacterium]